MKTKKERRVLRIRSKVKGNLEKPRISVFRSNKYLYVQLIDDAKGKTVFGLSEKQSALDASKKPVERARELGMLFAKQMKEKKVEKAVFDRGGYRYHGIVKAFAEGIREGGIVI